MTEHKFVNLMWKPDGKTAHHRALCSCGWISTTQGVGYGYPISHAEDFARHVEERSA